MSSFYQYKFTSPEPLFALVKEEFKSYFDTGMVDDLLFPIYLADCLEKLGKSSHPIVPVVLFVEDFQARLPDNFYAIREAWFCSFFDFGSYDAGVSFYSQSCDSNTIQLSPTTSNEIPKCKECLDEECGGCNKNTVQAVYKTIRSLPAGCYERKFLLTPGNISFREDCDYRYNDSCDLYGSVGNVGLSAPFSGDYDSFDLRDNKFITTFREGIVEVLMYASNYDDLDNQMMPDNYRIKEFVKAFLKYKIFEALSNQTTDETFNQIFQKMQMYKQMSDEAYILAESEIKKQTVHKKINSIHKLNRRFDKYSLPGTIVRGRKRRY